MNTFSYYATSLLLVTVLHVPFTQSMKKQDNQEALNAQLTQCINRHDTLKIKELIKNGAQVDAHDARGITHLIFLIKQDSLEMVQHLLDCGADPNVSDVHKNSPLHYATQSGSVYIMNALIKAGANIEQTDGCNRTPLLLNSSTYRGYHGGERDDRLDVLQALVQAGAHVTVCTRAGDTPLHFASSSGLLEHAQMLIQAGAPLNATNDKGQTPLHVGVQHSDILTLLIEHGADCTMRDKKGETAFEIVIKPFKKLVVTRILNGQPLAMATSLSPKDLQPYICAALWLIAGDVKALPFPRSIGKLIVKKIAHDIIATKTTYAKYYLSWASETALRKSVVKSFNRVLQRPIIVKTPIILKASEEPVTKS